MGLFKNRSISSDGKTQVPVWFMRQAGRYHSHYQGIKKTSDFMSMCKIPELACEVTMGPINDFHFDAAILFSDLLFPLEQLGLGLTYAPRPKLQIKLATLNDVKSLRPIENAASFYKFQGKACELLKKSLPAARTLLGFVGAPFTLFTYAVEGSHAGNLVSSKKGLRDGRWEAFNELLFENLLGEMKIQAEGGADAMCLFDTAAGELTLEDYRDRVLPWIRRLTAEFKRTYPQKEIIYYSKLTHAHYLREIQDSNIDVLGVDWRHNITEILSEFGNDYCIQGNLDPAYLHLSWDELESELKGLWQRVLNSKVTPERWVMGLGHGVLQHTPETNVKKAVEYVHQNFHY